MLGSEHILVSLRAAKDGQGWKNAIGHLQRPQSIGRYAPIGPYHPADQGIPYNPIVGSRADPYDPTVPRAVRRLHVRVLKRPETPSSPLEVELGT